MTGFEVSRDCISRYQCYNLQRIAQTLLYVVPFFGANNHVFQLIISVFTIFAHGRTNRLTDINVIS